MQMQGPNYASEFASRVSIPDMGALIPDFANSLAPALTELSRNVSSLVAVKFPMEQLESIQKMVNQASEIVIRDSALESYAEMMRSLTPALESLAQTALMPKMQASISAMASSLATAVDTSRMQNLLATASAFRAELADEEDLDELTDQFFASHPDLAESLEETPALYALSRADRRLIVWFVGFIVTLYVGNALLNIGTDYPEVKAMIDAFGLDAGGGLPAGMAAALLTDQALDKLPQKESE